MRTGATNPTTRLLTSRGITDVFHYAPLHYLLFIARSRALLSKDELRRLGYDISHFRRTSRRQDELRGFSSYVHLTLTKHPKILVAKLKGGCPHFELRFPAAHIEGSMLHLCRYNIAKSRYLKSGRKPPEESRANGRYHGPKELPTAETISECQELLSASSPQDMIEVLVPRSISIPPETEFLFFAKDDCVDAEELLRPLDVPWRLRLASDLSYTPASDRLTAARRFLQRARDDPHWRGDGLDFDYV
jgi:hypothetical protein